MQKIKTAVDLKNTIEQLGFEHSKESVMLKEQFLSLLESLKPINIIKSTIKEAVALPNLKSNLSKVAIGLTTGLLTGNTFLKISNNLLRRIIGAIIGIAISYKLHEKEEMLKSKGLSI